MGKKSKANRADHQKAADAFIEVYDLVKEITDWKAETGLKLRGPVLGPLNEMLAELDDAFGDFQNALAKLNVVERGDFH